MNDTNVKVPVGFESFGPWFNETIELLKAQWQTWVLVSLIYLGIAAGGGFIISLALPPLAGLVGFAASALFMPGMVQIAIKQIRGEAIAPGDIFSATDMFIGAALIIIALGIGVIACFIGQLVTGTLFFLAMPLLVDKKLGFADALKQSMEVTKQNFWFFLVYWLVISLVAGLGSIACGIGILVTMPIAIIGMAVAYERTFNGPAVAATPDAAPQAPPPAPPTE